MKKLVVAAAILAASAVLGGASAQQKLKIGFIYVGPIGDMGWSYQHEVARRAIVDEFKDKIDTTFLENVNEGPDAERSIEQLVRNGAKLVYTTSFGFMEATVKVAKDFPKVSFLLGSSGKPQEPNFSVFDNYIQEPAYLSGMVAGGMTKSNKIGMVGGFPIPEVNRLMNAFMAGAKETNPKVEFSVAFINSWFDPPKAKEAAFAMIDKGADVLYAERFGVSDAAKEKGKLAIGNVINTQDKYPDTVVSSALWNMEPTIDRALKLVKDGKFKPEDYGSYSMMKHKGSELAPLGTFEKKVPAEIATKVKAKEKDILDGKFTVKVDDNQPKSTAK